MSPLRRLAERGPANQQLRFDLPIPPRDRLHDLFSHRGYVALCLAVLCVVGTFTLRQEWGVALDVWEHAAASRQLGADPLHPGHPIFAVEKPHQFYSPYALALGLTSRVTGLSIVTVLSWAGVLNLVLLVTGLWLFLTRLVKRRDVAFWALLFGVFLWGPAAWNFSGFFHARVLPFVLPYPATLATALMFFAMWLHLRFLDSQDRRLLAAIAVLFATVLLTHPVDAVTLAVGIGALTLASPPGRLPGNLVASGATLAVGALAAFAWPYFSLFGLLFGESNQGYRDAIAADDHLMYAAVLGRVWPMLVVAPFVVRRFFADRRDPLAMWFVGLLLLYLYGWRAENWSYGRLIASVMLVGAMILADERVRAGEVAAALGKRGRPTLAWVQVTTIALLAVGVFHTRNGFAVLPRPVVEALPSGWTQIEIELADLSDYSFLPRFVGDGRVVLADGFTALEVPAFGGKVVASARPAAFVETAERGADVTRFFDAGTSEVQRRSIISKYGASYLLLRNSALATEPDKYGPLLGLGTVAYRNERFTLVDLHDVAG